MPLSHLAAVVLPSALPPVRLAPVDLAVVALYLVAITLFGLRFSRRQRGDPAGASLKSYFLAGNTIPWWAIALSIVSAETSTLTIISIPGVAFTGDLGFLQVVLGYLLGRVVVAVLFLPRYIRGEMLTAYQLIDRRFSHDGRFGHILHQLTAGLFLLTRAAAEGVRVFAISIVVSIAIGTGDVLSIALITGLTLLYTFEGGMAAVIWTDVVQMALYLVGTMVALWSIGHHVPGGWTQIHAVAAPLHKFQWLNFTFNLTGAYTFWAGLLGGTFLTMASHGTDQLMVQRMLSARSLRDSRLALLSSGAVIFLQFTLFLLIGVGLFVLYGLAGAPAGGVAGTLSPDRIFPTFIVRAMPHGAAGLLIAAILAAAMSNLSAALNSLASSTVIDFYLPWQSHRQAEPSPRTHTMVSRSATVFWALVLFVIAVYSIRVGGKGHVVETGLSIAAVAYGSILGVFLLGTLTRRATQAGAILGLLAGLGVNLALWLQPHALTAGAVTLPKVAFTWYVLIGSMVTFAVGLLGSLPKRRRLALGTMTLAALALPLSTRGQAMQARATGAKTEPQTSLPSPVTPDFTPVSTLLDQAIAAHKLPGAVVAIGHGGRVVFKRAYGSRELQPVLEPMTEDTLFDMASLTKVLVTTTAVLQLMEQGKLALDTPYAHYVPGYAQSGITLRDLLTHYSGLPEDVKLTDDWGLAAPDKAEAIRRALDAVPYGPPGLTFRYSDINFILLGHLVETLTSQPLELYARSHIFAPLAMGSTTYHAFDRACGPVVRVGDAVQPGPRPLGLVRYACPADTWSPLGADPGTAPTAIDDQGTALTNPDFGQLLLGTVDDPTARRMGGVAGHAGVFSTAGDMALFCQAMLDKLNSNTGPFPLSQATLRLATAPQQPATALPGATIFTPDGQTTKGIAQRGLGWDINSPFSRPRGTLFPTAEPGRPLTTPPSFGHTGYTGTSLWLDPASGTFVILLTNSVHIPGATSISGLRGQVATAAAHALHADPCTPGSACDDVAVSSASGPTPAPPSPGDARLPETGTDSAVEGGRTLTGIDVLEATGFQALKQAAARHGGHLRMALVTNASGLDSNGRRTLDLLATDAPKVVPNLKLTLLFTPEHGLAGRQDTEHLSTESDPATRLPIRSLYGPRPSDKRPTPADLAGLDAIVVDLQDAGVRFFTYETLLGYLLEATHCTATEVIVLDRPNPLGGAVVEGPVSLAQQNVYTNYTPLPLRHGLTLGELALYDEGLLGACQPQAAPGNLDAAAASAPVVVTMRNWTRAELWPQTGLPWAPPSPNLRSATAALLYPGVGLIEQTNLSVGRGTANPFENLGAPWIDSAGLAAYLTARHIAGVRFTPTTLTIAETAERYPYHGQTIPAIHLELTDAATLDSPELGLELLSALSRLYPGQFQLQKAATLLANPGTLEGLVRGDDPRTLAASWSASLAHFRRTRQPYLLYP